PGAEDLPDHGELPVEHRLLRRALPRPPAGSPARPARGRGRDRVLDPVRAPRRVRLLPHQELRVGRRLRGHLALALLRSRERGLPPRIQLPAPGARLDADRDLARPVRPLRIGQVAAARNAGDAASDAIRLTISGADAREFSMKTSVPASIPAT